MSRNESTISDRVSGRSHRRPFRLIGISLAAVILSVLPSWAQTVVRQPYLQLQTPTSMTIVWRTDTATDSRVRYGTVQGTLNQTATNGASATNHIVTITGLSPATKYFYDAGSTTTVQAGGTSEHYFVTSPTVGSTAPFRAWVVGDSGTGGSEQAAVRDAMVAYTGANRPHMMLHVGDIAYTSGTEQEFTDFHFGMYPDIFRHTVQWPTLGNHEGASTTSGQPGASTGPYYDAYVLPTAAEAGGTASGTEAYYSFDYGNVHFISLNAYQVSRSATGPMAVWLQNDLAATNAQWVIAFWHHPPYSHGTHNSDSETELREMRTNLVPILEAGGVDLVLCGHSHVYERSYLIDGTYSTPTPNFATLLSQGHILDDGDGKLTGSGAYQKGAGLNANEGAVYVVAGHGGAGMGGTLDHPVMYFSEAVHGSCLLDIDGNSLTLTNVRRSGVVSDTFTIQKGPQAPKVASTVPTKSAVLASLPTIRVIFTTNVTGVNAGDLTVNGSVATTLSGASGGSVYDFSGYAAPGNGHVGVVLAAGGIADAANGSLLFTGNTWSYTIDTTPPRVFSESPGRGQAIGVLPSITVNFSKAVTGVVASSLRVNGQPATILSGISGSSGPYTFTGFPAPPIGQVSISLLAGSIQDELSQPFAGDAWVYVLQPHLVINEYLNSNNTGPTDENGEHDDYVEIYNPAGVAVDMSGMHLTDTLDFPAQYRIPNGVVIPAYGHLVFWCDSQPGQGPFHTNFNLARAAESVALADTDANGFALIDSTSWVNGTTDVSVGRFPDGAPGFVNMPATAGATNTIACTTNPQCSALTDQCNTGVCTANQCVAQFANEGLSCDDGVACREPDTCTAGVCDGGPSTCTSGETCNLVTGLCEVPVADPLPIGVGVPWKYFKGSVAPPASWNEIVFDDSSWITGNSGFGYGTDCVTDRGTILSDMQNTYVSLYVRRLFHVDNAAAVQTLNVLIDHDDAVVVYINGNEVGRNNIVGTPPSNTALATEDHECSTPVPAGTNNPPQNFSINLATAQLVTGNNVIAIQAHNLTAGSSDFTLTPTVVATTSQGCAVTPECDDGNPCTDDACAGGLCEHTNADGNTCSDGIACTNDACSSGTCVNTSACPVGQTCNLGTGSCDATPVTVSFQQGAGSPVYSGTVDTFIQSGSATDNSAAVLLTVDGVPPTTDERQVLIRFDDIFGSGAGQIPAGATISSARLEVSVSNAMAQLTSFNRMLQTWSPTSTWSTFGTTPWNATQGVQADGVEAAATADPGSPASVAVSPPIQSITLTSSVQAWSAAPATNFGWVLRAAAADSLAFDSSEVTTIANRPKLVVIYTYSPPCSVDADCTDNNVCNGIETCAATVCQPGTPLPCSDANLCTTDSCNPASGCVFTNNTNPCSDGNACTTGDACAVGTCVSGGATNCDDANVCTDDSCNTLSGCAHANNTASCTDGNLCTTGDVCAAGTCGGTAVSCPIGQTCNPGTGACDAAPVVVTFRDGVGGYTGTQDAFLMGSQPSVTHGTLADTCPGTATGPCDNFEWDSEDPAPSINYGLVRFDGIVGAGVGQIPAGATVVSASLTIVAYDPSVAPPADVRAVLVDWAETTATTANFGGDTGVQVDEYGPDIADGPIASGTAVIDITTAVQGWVNSPANNFGLIFVPNSSNGVVVRSSEYATVAERPLLTVTFTAPATSCTIDQDCNDNNVCNGTETCQATVCQPGTALNCVDANVCTTDSCSPTLGCQNVNNTVACSDGNACTTNDTCAGGACVGGAAPNCNDGNVCTDDSCNTVTGCVNANNTASCTDGNLCTTADVCAGGTCGGTAVSCPIGQTCNPGTGVCQSGPTSLTFQQGASGYLGSVDTFLHAGSVTANNGAAVTLIVDGPGTVPADERQILLRFDGVFTSQGGPIPDGSSITSATLEVNITNISEDGAELHRMLVPWTASSSWSSLTNGVQLDGVESLAAADVSSLWNGALPHVETIDVTPSLAAWSAGAVKQGWVFVTPAGGDDSWQFDSAEATTVANRPRLTVTYTPPVTGCTIDQDCNDNNVCNGTETCQATVCQPGTALNCVDANVCTTDSCSPTLGCQNVNNTVACSDGNACTTNDTCAGGACVGGAAPNCDDSNVCTDDSCNTVSGCVHANNTASCSDGNLCTTGDVCAGGTCGGTAVSCPIGQTCNPGTGVCQSGPTTLTFQQGASGYLGSADTYIDTALGSQATVSPIVIDGSPVEQALLKFDAIFGTGPNQIPPGSTISSATLTLWVGVNTDDGCPNPVNFHRLLHAWNATDIWAAYGVAPWNATAGIQADGVDALAATAATATMTTLATAYPVDVTTSLQAWVASPSTNFGWAILPTNTDGLRLESNESTTASNARRPSLSVTFTPPAVGCTIDQDCSDNNLCNGIETCAATVCQPGTALNCVDANVCTTDSCSPTLGCQNVHNTAPCNDGLACTAADICSGGTCAGTQITCDDGVACTTDTCVEGPGCQHVSSCPGGGSCNAGTGLCTAAVMECSPSTIGAASSSTADLIVTLRNLGGLAPVRGYQTQISIARTSGTGTVSVGCPGGVEIDGGRPDYLFAGAGTVFPATNCGLLRAASSLLSGGVTAPATASYLAGYTLTTSADATSGSTFTISLDAPAASSLVDPTGQAIAFDRGPACTLTIASCATAGDCDDGNPCTVDTCDLSLGCQHTPGNSGTVCRPSAAQCDAEETCTGTSAVCPADQASPNGTPCTDGNACTQTDTCQSGTCVGANPLVCNDSNPCTDDGCNPLDGLCAFVANDANACTDGNVCTTDACSAGACVHTSSGVCGVSGTVRYYRTDASGGSEPSTKPVPSVGIDRTQDAAADATTGSSGTYAFSSVSGNVTLTTVAKFGSPRASDHNGAISSLDASLVARAGALLVTLSPNQRIAADVTGDGTVGAFDASFVARFAADLIDHFGVATTTGSDWKFLRCDAYAFPGDPGCGSPDYAFTPISQAESGKDFYAILYGDVTGNWQPAALFSSVAERALPSIEGKEAMPADQPSTDQPAHDAIRNPASPPAEVSIDRFTTPLRSGERRELAIRLDNADGILGLDLTLRYDATSIKIVGVQPTGIATGWGLAHSDQRGAHRITTYGVQPLAGSGAAAIVTVEGIAGVGSAKPIQIDGIANEGTISLRARRGGLTQAEEVPEGPSGDR